MLSSLLFISIVVLRVSVKEFSSELIKLVYLD